LRSWVDHDLPDLRFLDIRAEGFVDADDKYRHAPDRKRLGDPGSSRRVDSGLVVCERQNQSGAGVVDASDRDQLEGILGDLLLLGCPGR
jgi:hypothetical protein